MKIVSEVRLGICADGYGSSHEVNAAVVELAWQSRLSATSCLVDGPAFVAGADTLLLLRRAGLVDVGLHLDLTSGAGKCWPRGSPADVLARTLVSAEHRRALRAEIRRQLDRFQQVLGCTPDHIDGHRHVHQIPVVRRVLLEEVQRSAPDRLPWVRRARPSWLAGRQLAQQGFRSNRAVLAFSRDASNVEQTLARLDHCMRSARDGDLMPCRPATPPGAGVAFATGGHAEYRVLGSRVLPAVLAQHRVRLMRPSQWLLPAQAA